MQFFIIRSSPILMALLFLVSAHLLRYAYQQWMIIFLVNTLVISGYFGWLAWRLERLYFWPLLFYVLILFWVGMGSIIFMPSQILVQSVIVLWTVFVLILFEALFHYLYKTEKRYLADVAQVVNYYNGIIFFAFVAIVFNGIIFLRFNPLLAWFSIGVVGAILFFTQLRINKAQRDISLALFVGLMCVQFVFALHFLSLGVHVVAAITTLGFYWMTSVILANIGYMLTQRRFITYSVVTILLMGVVLFSAQWL
jgi:hypothetical protein